jgi:hypothetical protein
VELRRLQRESQRATVALTAFKQDWRVRSGSPGRS